MTEVNEQELERRLKIFAEVEQDLAAEQYLQNTAGCPSLSRVPEAALNGWLPEDRDHVALGCPQCRKWVAMQWNLAPPSLRTIVRHIIDGTLPEEEQIRKSVQNADQASRLIRNIRLLSPLLKTLQQVSQSLTSASPGLTVATGTSFAPVDSDELAPVAINYIHPGLRWTAPIEDGKQYVYVEAIANASVAMIIGSSPEAKTQAEPLLKKADLVPLVLRETPFTWRVSSYLGDAVDLTEAFGNDYEVVVAILSGDV